MEQTPFPGSIGDSCAETSRLVTLQVLNGEEIHSKLSLFVTKDGIIRYPSSPWKENDTSSDQVCPLIAATALTDFLLTNEIIDQLRKNNYETGNDDFITLELESNLRRAQKKSALWISDLAILGQAIILKLPIAINPNATKNPLTWLISSKNQSSGYLNFINTLAFAKATNTETLSLKLAKKLIKQDKILQEVKSYYQLEPNSQWIIDKYTKALGKIY